MTKKDFNHYRTLLSLVPDDGQMWLVRSLFEGLTQSQMFELFIDMAVRGWERRNRIFLPCGLVWERTLSEDGTRWIVADITAQIFP